MADNSNLHSALDLAGTNLSDSPASNQPTQPDPKLAAALARIAELESKIEQFQAKQADSPPGNGTLRLSGTWLNTNNGTRGITRVTIPDAPQNDLSIMVWTASSPKDIEMPTVQLHRLTSTEGSSFPQFPERFAMWDLGSRKDYLLVHFHPEGICTELVIIDQKPAGITHTGFYLKDGLAPAF
jgi:hypothetical protein